MIDSDNIRISVAIARSGVASRRGAETLVRERRVTVDGQLTTDLSLRVNPRTQEITLDGRPLPEAEPQRYYALNKPRGVLSSARDDRGRRTVIDLLPADAPRCVPVGRLDLDIEGLILLPNEGEMSQARPARPRRAGRRLRDRRTTSWMTLTLHTGRKREVRRLCDAIGHPVVTLRRVRFGPLLLQDLPEGVVRPLSRREIRLLRRAAGLVDDSAEAER